MTNHAAGPAMTASPAARSAPRTACFVAAMIVGAVVTGRFASFTWQATMGVSLCAALVLAAGGRVPGRPTSPPPDPPGRREALPWWGWCGAFTAWWGSAFLTGSRPSHPTLSLLLDPVFGTHAGKSLGLLAWMLLGWWLVRR